MAESLALADRIRAEKLKEQIRMLEKEQAESACKALKRSDIACMAIKN